MNKESGCSELKIQSGNYMSRGLKAVCVLVLMALSCWPSARGWAAQDAGPLPQVQAELPGNLKVMQDALQSRQAAQFPPGPLNDSNAAVVQILTDLVQRATALQSLLAAGPTPTEASLIVEEWKKIKAKMPDVGLTPQEQGASATSPGAAQPSPSPQASNQGAVATALTDFPGMTFAYDIGISFSAKFNAQGKFQGGCTIGKGGITSDAPIWDVVVTLGVNPVTKFHYISQFYQTNDQVVLVPVITMDQTTQLLLNGRRAYIGRAEQNLVVPKFHFSDLTLNEVTDLLQTLKSSDAKIKETFNSARPRATVFQILLPPGAGTGAPILRALEGSVLTPPPAGTAHQDLMDQLTKLAGTDQKVKLRNGQEVQVHIQGPASLAYATPAFTGDSVEYLTQLASDLANLGHDSGKAQNKRIEQLKAQAKAQGADAAAVQQVGTLEQGGPSTGEPLIIENECFKLSFVPGIQNGGISPAADFKGRVSYLPENIPLALKLGGEGEAASDPAKPRRVAGSGDFTFRSKPVWGGWYFTVGATGESSYEQLAGIGVTEWRGGGKFELQTPVQKFFPVRGGNDQKPTLTIEAGGIGGSTPNTNTNFVVRGDFVYTLQPDAKMFLDFRAAAGHSQDGRFAGRNDFSFGGITGRYTLYKDWDFIAKYQCGRQDPLYVKSCGWQTGFGIKTK
jgi:hypothetical protein